MPQWTSTVPPKFSPNAVPSIDGWCDPITNELLAAMSIPPVVINTPATITKVSLENQSKTFKTGDVVVVRVYFSQKVLVTGTPQLTVKINSNNRTASYFQGSGSAVLWFKYTVVSGDAATAGQFFVGVPAVQAAETVGATNSQVAYKAVTAGTGGNSITIAHVNGGASQTLSVGVSGNAITVNLGTNGSSVVTSTAAQVIAAITASVPAKALVTASTGTGDGTGVAATIAATAMSGGTAATLNSVALNSGTILDKAVYAALTSGTSNSQVALTAKNFGTRGNNISLTVVNPGTNNATLAVTVSGNDITVSLATNGSAAATSTSTQVVAAITGSASASALVTATIGAGNGTGVVAVAAKANLTGGTGSASVAATPLTFTPPVYSTVTVN